MSLTAEWTVDREEYFGAVPEPFCTGSESFTATLLKPARTSLLARENVSDCREPSRA